MKECCMGEEKDLKIKSRAFRRKFIWVFEISNISPTFVSDTDTTLLQKKLVLISRDCSCVSPGLKNRKAPKLDRPYFVTSVAGKQGSQQSTNQKQMGRFGNVPPSPKIIFYLSKQNPGSPLFPQILQFMAEEEKRCLFLNSKGNGPFQ